MTSRAIKVVALMTKMSNRYFIWLIRKIGAPTGFNRLFRFLDSVDFTYRIEMDGNRYEDGIELRYQFARENSIDYREISATVDVKPCSVFEMMCALALRIEHDIMAEPDGEDRTWTWFEAMLENSGLINEEDYEFDEERATEIVQVILQREYGFDGSGGGLFYLPDPPKDLRNTEIWYQAMWWLGDYI